MTDIVDRLLKRVLFETAVDPYKLMREAAAEIEHLRLSLSEAHATGRREGLGEAARLHGFVLNETGGARLLNDGSLGCYDCGKPYGQFPDLIIDNDAFARIAPNPPDGGILCPNCINDRLVDAGLENVSAKFTSGPMSNQDQTETLDARAEGMADAFNECLRICEKLNRPGVAAAIRAAMEK